MDKKMSWDKVKVQIFGNKIEGIRGFEYTPSNIPDVLPIIDFNMSDEIMRQAVKNEEKLLIEILTKALGRTPIEDDFRECAKVSFPNFKPLEYIFTYKNIRLGFVSYDLMVGSCTIKFTPDTNKNFLVV